MLRFIRQILLVYLLLNPLLAWAGDSDIYMISSVPVNVSDKSPALAKNNAHNAARRSAFVTLLGRIDKKVSVADSVSDDEISEMVRSEQIENEKISGNNYSATFNILFAKDFVDHILAQKDPSLLKNEAIEEEKFLLIPLELKKNQSSIWGEDNDWKEAITDVLEKKSLKKFIIPQSDIETVATIGEGKVVNLDYVALATLLNKNKANIAYVLAFSYDENGGKVIVAVSTVSRSQKKQVKLSFANVNKVSDVMDKVAAKTIDYVNAQTAINKSVAAGSIRVKIYIDSLSDWLAIKNKLENSGLSKQINIESLSNDNVIAVINYAGDGDFRKSFAKKGIALIEQSENYYIINAN